MLCKGVMSWTVRPAGWLDLCVTAWQEFPWLQMWDAACRYPGNHKLQSLSRAGTQYAHFLVLSIVTTGLLKQKLVRTQRPIQKYSLAAVGLVRPMRETSCEIWGKAGLKRSSGPGSALRERVGWGGLSDRWVPEASWDCSNLLSVSLEHWCGLWTETWRNLICLFITITKTKKCKLRARGLTPLCF